MKRKLLHMLITGAAALSLNAVAGGEQNRQEPRAQSGQTQQSGQAQSRASHNPELVKQTQEKLSAAGHEAGPADGKMGPKTQAALKEFQQSKGLEASGRIDQQTLAELGISGEGSASSSTGATSGSSSGPSSSAERTAEPKPQGAGPAIGEMPSDKSSS